MTLFPETLLEDLRRLPGGGYSFLKQVAGPDGAPVRASLDVLADRVGAPVAARWSEIFNSLDNRRFFQGFAEAATVGMLLETGWELPDLSWPGPGLLAISPQGLRTHLLVLAFVRQIRPEADGAAIARLRAALGRVGARRRIGLVVNRWLPHDFDPEPIRQAVELWLREVERGAWSGRYAAYEDEHISLEFALTGEVAGRGQSILAFSLGPFQAHRTLDAVGGRMVQELDRHRLRAGNGEAVFVACVLDQPWRLPRGYVRDLLYGRSIRQTLENGRLESAFAAGDAPSLYRDVLYDHVTAVAFLERPENGSAAVTGQAFLNPWTTHQIPASSLSIPTLAPVRWEDGMAVMAMEAVGEERSAPSGS